MHDFVSYLFYLLQRGMRFAVPAALICGLILAVCYTVCRRQGRRFLRSIRQLSVAPLPVGKGGLRAAACRLGGGHGLRHAAAQRAE